MRSIAITVDALGAVTTDGVMLGYSGEHNAAVLSITFSEDFLAADYYRIAVDGKYSEEIYRNENKLEYTVPQQFMQPPAVSCQIIGYTVQNGEPTVIVKSAVFELEVKRSEQLLLKADNEPDILEKTLETCRIAAAEAKLSAAESETSAESSESFSQAAESAANFASSCALAAAKGAESAEISTAKAEAAAEQAQNAAKNLSNVSNALISSASGQSVSVTDVSPIPHEMKISASGKGSAVTETVIEEQSVPIDGSAVATSKPVDNLTVSLESSGYASLCPVLEALGEVKSAEVSCGGAVNRAEVTYTLNGNVLSWSGTVSELTETHEVVSTEEISGSVELELSDGEQISGIATSGEGSIYVSAVTVVGEAVNVTVKGKNRWDWETWLKNSDGITYNEETGFYEGTAAKFNAVTGRLFTAEEDGKKVTLSATMQCDEPCTHFEFYIMTSYSGTYMYCYPRNGVVRLSQTVVAKEGGYIKITYGNGGSGICRIKDIQLEIGDSPTEYQEYICDTYTVDSEGSVTVPSVCPLAEITSDSEEAVLEVEYQRDINKAFSELAAALAAVGGSV